MARLRINQGLNLTLDASTTDFIVKNLNIGGFDLKLGTTDQSSRGNSGQSRALVKHNNATLVIKRRAWPEKSIVLPAINSPVSKL